VLADHFDKRLLLMATQSAMATLAFALFATTAAGLATLPLVYAFTFLLGCVTAVDNPTRQSFVTEMVGTEQLANAVGLNSAVFNASRILGPALAGIISGPIRSGEP
jgi:MFS family permease